MTTITKTIKITKTPTNGSGTFEGVVDANPPDGDHDGERIDSWKNLPTTVPLGFSHLWGDPEAEVGSADVLLKSDGRHLLVLGQLDIDSDNTMAQVVYERLLLPPDDKRALKELSVGFEFDDKQAFKDAKGVKVIVDARLLEISIVYAGAQNTAISNVKTLGTRDLNGVVFDISQMDPQFMADDKTRPFYIEVQGDEFVVFRITLRAPEEVSRHSSRSEAEDAVLDLLAEYNAERETEPAKYLRLIHEAAYGVKQSDPAVVDAFIAEQKEVAVQEALEADRQYRWEQSMSDRARLTYGDLEAQERDAIATEELRRQAVSAERDAERAERESVEEAHEHYLIEQRSTASGDWYVEHVEADETEEIDYRLPIVQVEEK